MAASISRTGNRIDIQVDSNNPEGGVLHLTYKTRDGYSYHSGRLTSAEDLGFKFTDKLGRELKPEQLQEAVKEIAKTFGVELKPEDPQAAEKIANAVIVQNFDAVENEMTAILNDRVQKRDGIIPDAVVEDDIEGITESYENQTNALLLAMSMRALNTVVKDLDDTQTEEVETWFGLSSERQTPAKAIDPAEKTTALPTLEAGLKQANSFLFSESLLPINEIQTHLDETNLLSNARDWINENRDALNALIRAEIPQEQRALFEISAIPEGYIKLSDPAFAKTYAAALNIITRSEESALPSGADDALTQLNPVRDYILTYSNIYNTIGDDAPVSDNPQEAMEQGILLAFKAELDSLDKSGIFGDLPDFDYKTDPFEPTESGFINSWATLMASFEKSGIPMDKLPPSTEEFIQEVRQNRELTELQKTQTLTAMQLRDFALSLPTETQETIGQAVQEAMHNVSPIDLNKVQPPTQSPSRDAKPVYGEPAPTPKTLQELYPKQFRNAVFAVENAFFNNPAYGVTQKPDGIYDSGTQGNVTNAVTSLFEKYGKDYYESNTTLQSTTGDNVYSFNKDGEIFTINEDGEKEATGHKITDGIDPKDGQLPHEAVALFFQQLDDQKELELSSLKIDKQGHAQRALDNHVNGFFNANPALANMEDDIRDVLSSSSGNKDAFEKSQAGKDLRKSMNDDAAYDAFIIAALGFQNNFINFGADYDALENETNEVSALSNLLSMMSQGKDYDPALMNRMRDAVGFTPDNILSVSAYETIRNMHEGQFIPTQLLYDDKDSDQGKAILKEFGSRAEVTREEVHTFVRKQFDLRAIKTLSGAEPSPEQDIDQFILDNADVLDGVSQAMHEGHFNPYEKDVELTFKAFERPDINNPGVRGMINMYRNNSAIPTATFALKYMDNAELESVTGREGFARLSRTEQENILTPLLNLPTDELLNNPGYERMMMNFYEGVMADYTSFRNGDINDESMDTWNGRYGEPNQDQLMYLYMRQNWHHMNDIFGADEKRIFFNSTGSHLNMELNYEEAMENLSPEHQKILTDGINDLHNPSMYSYLIDYRLDHYRDMRNQKYLPNRQDEKLAKEFNKTTNPDAETDAETSASAPEESSTISQPEAHVQGESDTNSSDANPVSGTPESTENSAVSEDSVSSEDMANYVGTINRTLGNNPGDALYIDPQNPDEVILQSVTPAFIKHLEAWSNEIAEKAKPVRDAHGIPDTQIAEDGQWDADETSANIGSLERFMRRHEDTPLAQTFKDIANEVAGDLRPQSTPRSIGAWHAYDGAINRAIKASYEAGKIGEDLKEFTADELDVIKRVNDKINGINPMPDWYGTGELLMINKEDITGEKPDGANSDYTLSPLLPPDPSQS